MGFYVQSPNNFDWLCLNWWNWMNLCITKSDLIGTNKADQSCSGSGRKSPSHRCNFVPNLVRFYNKFSALLQQFWSQSAQKYFNFRTIFAPTYNNFMSVRQKNKTLLTTFFTHSYKQKKSEYPSFFFFKYPTVRVKLQTFKFLITTNMNRLLDTSLTANSKKSNPHTNHI